MSGGLIAATGLWLRTLRNLRPAQIAHRLRLKAQSAVLRHVPQIGPRVLRAPERPMAGWPEAFVPIDARLAEGHPNPENNAAGRFEFLGDARCLGEPADWRQAGATRLWRYHLHYFEWAWPFAVHADRDWARDAFGRLWRSWRRSTAFGCLDAWSPYVASVRSWVLTGLYGPLVAGSGLEATYLDDLRLHAGFVRAHLEFDVGGNHLVKNLKALVGLGVFLGDEELVRRAVRHLERQLTVQVLDDGGHFERSPSYHCQVLGDLADVAALLRAAGEPPVPGLDHALAAMREWLATMLMPDGDVPLFNDCTLVGPGRLAALEPGQRPPGQLVVLGSSGYVVLRVGARLHLVADVGPPCPAELPAHAHADCLSFELSVDGHRVVVDTGTSTYEAGPRRSYERSTRAHNTLEVDGADQTEVWATFRAARMAGATLEWIDAATAALQVTASHDGYTRLRGRPGHRRTWRMDDSSLEVVDEVVGRGRHRVSSYVHLAPDVVPVTQAGGLVVAGPLAVRIRPSGWRPQLRTADVATSFGRRRPTRMLVVTCLAELPVTLRTRFEVRDPADGDQASTIPPQRGEDRR